MTDEKLMTARELGEICSIVDHLQGRRPAMRRR